MPNLNPHRLFVPILQAYCLRPCFFIGVQVAEMDAVELDLHLHSFHVLQ